MNKDNLFKNIPKDLLNEVIGTLACSGNVRIERIVSLGQASEPDFWYDQDMNEFVLLLQGKAQLAFENHSIDLLPGDYLIIKAHVKHRVAWTDQKQPSIWLTVHY